MRATQKWIREDKRELGKLLKELTDEENLKYGLDTGHIDEEEFELMKKEARK